MTEKTVPAKPNRTALPTRPAAVPPLPQPNPAPSQIWPYWPDQPAPQTQRLASPIWRRLTYLSLGWLLAVLLALGITLATAGVLLFRSDVIAPGVSVAGVDIGGQPMAEAATALRQQSQDRGIVLQGDGFEQALIPEALGISLNAEATVKLARQQGRSLETLRQFIDNRGQVKLEPVWQFDSPQAKQTLEALAPNFEIAPVDADIHMINGQVTAIPATPGQALDVDATLSYLTADPLKVLDEGHLPLALKTIPADLTNVSQAVTAANEFLDHTILVQGYDPISDEDTSFEIESEMWQPWISIELNTNDPTQFDWSLDTDKASNTLAAKIEALGPQLYLKQDETLDAVTAAITQQSWTTPELRVFHNESRHTVQFGETLSSIGFDYGIPYPWIEEANPGVKNSLTPGQEIIIPSPDELLPLPVVRDKRLVVSLSEQKMWAYEKGELKWEWPVSTGISSSPTAPGVFQVQTHETNAYAANWNLWMPDFIGIYRPVPTSGFMNGFHGFPSRNGSVLLWTDDLGHRVTYGCVLVDSQVSGELFNWAEKGVIVEIKK